MLYFWHPLQDADCRMQTAEAAPKLCTAPDVQDADAECRMQKRAQSYSCERRAGCRMQNAECKNSPTARRERTEYLLWEKLFSNMPVSDIGERLDGASN